MFSLELLLPGGVLGMIALAILFYSAFWCFEEMGSLYCIYYITLSIVFHFLGIYFELKILQKTGFGKKWLLRRTNKEHVNIGVGGHSELVDQEGIAETNLNPNGIISISEETYEANSPCGFIQKGDTIKILTSNRYKITVKKL